MQRTRQDNHKKLVLGGGCFWCLEAVFQRVNGVTNVLSGYTGGEPSTANYQQVCSGNSGHAEVVEINYDQSLVSINELLSIFFAIHDPTTLNRQGNDVGSQYRSIICYSNDVEKSAILEEIKKQQTELENNIVTEVSPLSQFYPAEIEHSEYYNRNASQPYCQIMIKPKLEKLLKMSNDKQ